MLLLKLIIQIIIVVIIIILISSGLFLGTGYLLSLLLPLTLFQAAIVCTSATFTSVLLLFGVLKYVGEETKKIYSIDDEFDDEEYEEEDLNKKIKKSSKRKKGYQKK